MSGKPNPYVTVFTPAYNRCGYLGLLYESLKEQDFDNFEWVIVDDGSTDGTGEAVRRFIADNEINIRYHYQENAGKHVAVNKGVQLGKGELFFTVDSDDTLAPHALSAIVQQWQAVLELPEADSYAGVCGLRVHEDGRVIGGAVDYEVMDVSPIDYRFKLNYKGDRAEVIRRSIMAQYPYPEIANERFCADALTLNRIGCRYMLRYFKDGIYVCEYLAGGITDSSVQLRRDSPKGACLYYAEMAALPGLTKIQRLKAALNYWRFAVYDKQTPFRDHRRAIGSYWSYIMFPAAWMLKLVSN
ncbi:glycosyltransferase family 2 protein [Parapedobacter sp. 10938]|uniref:glycosyltransferase family 2 protein n=1 Tax=Parapedobacter flavus TaxID=3110225 RepID=UPI002DBA1FF9|nr:glycosyltransferase family A protein [Parapedobacter sp. 10938]MEC3879545.1 glycosyltransferase family A protein [Parapedobacter sp. 10938]